MSKKYNRVLAGIISLTLMFSMTITVSAVENEMDSNSYDSSNTSVSYPEASTNKIAVNDIYLMDSEDMSFGTVYNPAILRSNSPKYCGLKVKLTKQGDITLSMTATSNKVSLLFVDSNGSIKEKYDYTGRTNEVGQIKLAKVPAGNYYVVIYNKGVTSDTVVSDLFIKSSVIFDITDTGKLKATTDYSKNEAVPAYKFKYNGVELKENVDYKVLRTSSSNKKISGGIEYSFTVEIQGLGNYVGKTSRTFINSVDDENNKINFIECEVSEPTYKGENPVFVVKHKGKILTENKDYKIVINTSDVTKSGVTYRTYNCTFIGMGNYAGSFSYKIENHKISDTTKKNISSCSITPVFSKGEFVKLIVMDNDKTLAQNTDYTYTVTKTGETEKNGITTISYEIVVYGIGSYIGSCTANGTTQKNGKIVLNFSDYSVGDKEYTGRQITPNPTLVITDRNGKEITLKKDEDYTITYGSNTAVGFLAGNFTIKGIGNYTGTSYIRFNIVPAKINDIKGSPISVGYTGKAATPFNDKIRLSDGRAVLYGIDYTVEYSNNVKIGTATAVIKFKGNYQGTVTKKFSIVEGTTLSKGDVNGDGKINITDITLAAAHIKGRKIIDSKDDLLRVDVNEDGKVNITDIVVIAAHIKGKKTLK
ncbi:dockerin type I repeat-containing protein [Ruminococcus albus]|uniref:Dockerin type 1 n=1 Tax=Ruminococcus albus (strain ATCC 27210 / DSM 20455 / JCM 14654 / NCDO 2250 / 7) TaxID=697329 RepID=E6UK31_RUMA7|nr:dockerin type I repeat-containing protein [Ruminococcus albus]ADU24027.1 Dockerin type 1 [Ruminococcus albus 7 = DSM 20455]